MAAKLCLLRLFFGVRACAHCGVHVHVKASERAWRWLRATLQRLHDATAPTSENQECSPAGVPEEEEDWHMQKQELGWTAGTSSAEENHSVSLLAKKSNSSTFLSNMKLSSCTRPSLSKLSHTVQLWSKFESQFKRTGEILQMEWNNFNAMKWYFYYLHVTYLDILLSLSWNSSDNLNISV